MAWYNGRCWLLLCCATSVYSAAKTPASKDILMRGAHPRKPDAYLCTSYVVEEEETYVVKFEALANADTAHHILIYGCEDGPASELDIWDCPPICRGGPQQIMFAWAKNAPPTQLPEGVGFRIGRSTSIHYIVMQIHYAKSFADNESPDQSGIRLHVTPQRQPYVAGIFLMMSFSFSVPPNNPRYHVDISCPYTGSHTMFPFAFRTHAHGLATVISGYLYNSTGYHMIGKGNPQWPQAFYPSNNSVEIQPMDKLVARCTYNSSGMGHSVNVGSTGNDEMCNFYIMFYTDSSVRQPSSECGGVQFQNLVDQMPADSDITLPPNPLMDEEAHGHHHHHSMGASSTQPAKTELEKPTHLPLHDHVPIEPLDKLVWDSKWPQETLLIGQVGGVATDSSGNVYIFHRGERVWDYSSFDKDNNYMHKDEPIAEDVIMIFTPEGKLMKKFGAGKFYMPHGIAVDSKGNIWLTDVALHQVFRFPAGKTEPDLTLGERFVHRDDAAHFCKPTDVAILESGEFFVSDGYCNSRILKFSKDGNLLKQWGRNLATDRRSEPQPLEFVIPHSVSVADDKKLLFVADRENGRIQCFDLDGNIQYIIKFPEFGGRLFAVEYCPQHGGLLFAVNGPSFDGQSNFKVSGFTMMVSNTSFNLQEIWNLPSREGLQNPHDVAVDVKGHSVYVGELNPNMVWKFAGHPNSTVAPTSTPAGTTTTTTTNKNTTNAGPASKEDSRKETQSRLDLARDGILDEGTTAQSDFTPSIIIGVLLVIPVVLLLVITIVMRMHSKGWDGCLSGIRKPKVFTLQGIMGNSHKGFDKLSQDDSDHDADVLSDSDNEEFRQPGKNKA